ncbi:MAG: hypothetical protein K2J39_13615, partial [Ruminococcus sp.]|nr:hypothetical protein [Ruminococcus sp.]
NNWLVGIEFDKKINGIPILNEDAEMPCNVGSVITVKKPLMPIIPVVPELSAINGNSDSLSSSENTVSEKNAVNPVNNNDTSEESAEKNSDKKKYYKLCCDSEYESAFRPFIKKIKNSCSESEFNFLEKKPLNWKISGEEDFCFKDLYYVNNQVLIINKQIWYKALSIVETDEIFQIPLEITKNGEKHYYNIIFLARIDCIDYRGKIISGNTGRYNIFKSKISEDYSVYVSEKLMTELKEFTTLKFKGVD